METNEVLIKEAHKAHECATSRGDFSNWQRLGLPIPKLCDALVAVVGAPPAQVDEVKLAEIAYFALRDAGKGRTVSENLSRKIARAQVRELRGGAQRLQ